MRRMTGQDASGSAGPGEDRLADIFLSYAREDARVAERLVSALTQRGWSVFWDRTIPVGKQWDDVLKDQLRKARCVVVLWSSHSVGSEWVLHEASIARHKGVLVPALLEPVLDKDSRVAAVFGAVQSIPLMDFADAPDARTKDLIAAIERRIGRPKKALWMSLAVILVALLAWKGSDWFQSSAVSLQDAVRVHRNDQALRIAGVKWISWGPFDSDENARDFRLVREAKTIDMIVTNANQFASTFRTDLKTFFGRPDARMRVIFASPETPFYEQMAKMTGKIWENAAARQEDILRIDRSRQELLSDATSDAQLEFRHFDTQYRMPLILIDGKYCILTVRLPPDEGQESLRIESDDSGVPTAASSPASSAKPRLLPHVGESCRAHFERMWNQSLAAPVKY